MIKVYNSVTQKKEELKTIKDNEVSMYVCGPTVYNYVHIGNARPMVTFDVLRRVLEYKGYKVTHISNFTDVDDKIINKAIEDGVSEKDITSKFIDAYLSDSKALNIKEPTHRPLVTESMDQIIKFIDLLIQRGFAYNVNGDVYFRVSKIKDYGHISNKKVDELLSGARIEANTDKENPLDFTLWKKTDKGITWDSPWSKGRPGWHTECVVMINDIAGPLIDIHGGGFDLKFPHHENEVAQAQGAFDSHLANYWMHNGFINMDGEKMSKSIGNVKWLRDVIASIGANTLRTVFYMTHYTKPLNFTDDAINQASTFVTKFVNSKKMVEQYIGNVEASKEGEFITRFVNELSDDMNTPNALSVMLEANKDFNIKLRAKDTDGAKAVWAQIMTMLELLAINI